MTERLVVDIIYPDYEEEDEYIMHTNIGVFAVSKEEIEKISQVIR